MHPICRWGTTYLHCILQQTTELNSRLSGQYSQLRGTSTPGERLSETFLPLSDALQLCLGRARRSFGNLLCSVRACITSTAFTTNSKLFVFLKFCDHRSMKWMKKKNRNKGILTVRSFVRQSVRPTDRPTDLPVRPSVRPTDRPSVRPSVRPSDRPSFRPSFRPSTVYSDVRPLCLSIRQTSDQPSFYSPDTACSVYTIQFCSVWSQVETMGVQDGVRGSVHSLVRLFVSPSLTILLKHCRYLV